MSLTQEQIIELKNQLKEQVSHLPPDKKSQAFIQIEALSSEALEELLREQQSKNTNQKKQPNKSVFRMIVDGDIPSVKIDENKFAVAVLDIMPISKSHTIIIPKKAIIDAKQMPSGAFSLAKKIGKKITSIYKASSVEIQTETKFDESIINLIPCYDQKLNINSQRSKSEIKDLEDIARPLKPKKRIEKIKINRKTNSESPILKLSRRIP